MFLIHPFHQLFLANYNKELETDSSDDNSASPRDAEGAVVESAFLTISECADLPSVTKIQFKAIKSDDKVLRGISEFTDPSIDNEIVTTAAKSPVKPMTGKSKQTSKIYGPAINGYPVQYAVSQSIPANANEITFLQGLSDTLSEDVQPEWTPNDLRSVYNNLPDLCSISKSDQCVAVIGNPEGDLDKRIPITDPGQFCVFTLFLLHIELIAYSLEL